MSFVAVGAAVVGAGIAIYGAVSSANDQSQLDQEKADAAKKQAQELAARQQVNDLVKQSTAMRQKLQYGATYAASGKAGVGIGAQLQIQNQANVQQMISDREAAFQEQMLMQSAQIDTSLASETQSAGTLNAIGAGVQGAGRVASLETSGGKNPGYGGPQGMGAYPTSGVNGGG
jgi:hypothetical protein